MTSQNDSRPIFHPLTAAASALSSVQLRQARRFAVQFLYQLDAQQTAVFKETDFQIFASQLDIPADERDFVRVLAKETFERLTDIDGLVGSHSKNWKLSRIARVDLAIVRACVAELMVRPEVTPAMILADAAEIGKEYGTTSSSVFVNGLLDGISRTIRP